MMSRKHDATGRSTSTIKTKARQKIAGQFVAKRLEMLEHPAYAALSLVALRMMTRIEIEHCHQGGAENGKLIVTYADFERHGVRRKSIPDGLRELEVFGFLQVVTRGRAAAYDYRTPSTYRLTYLNTLAGGPTDEWARLSEDDVRIADEQLKAERRPVPSQDIDSRGKYAPDPVGANTPPKTAETRGENAPENEAKKPPAFKSAESGAA